jgi:hypothetical protein
VKEDPSTREDLLRGRRRKKLCRTAFHQKSAPQCLSWRRFTRRRVDPLRANREGQPGSVRRSLVFVRELGHVRESTASSVDSAEGESRSTRARTRAGSYPRGSRAREGQPGSVRHSLRSSEYNERGMSAYSAQSCSRTSSQRRRSATRDQAPARCQHRLLRLRPCPFRPLAASRASTRYLISSWAPQETKANVAVTADNTHVTTTAAKTV